jgi:Ca2+-binding EF-hand superfamily protein
MNWKPLLAAALLAGLPAAATPAAAQGLDELRQADANGDGAIEIGEARDAAKTHFAMADANHDGTLSEKEFTDSVMRRLAQLDTDGDGKITRQEMRARAIARWRDR